MRLHTNQLGLRILGTSTGVGFLAVAAFAAFGGDALGAYVEGRAHGFALAAVIAGIWAIGVSWLDSDLRGVWCRPPKRWR